MSEPIYEASLAQFVRKHGHLPGERPENHSKRPVGRFRKLLLGPRP